MTEHRPVETPQPDLIDEAQQIYSAAAHLAHAERDKWQVRADLAVQEWHLSKRAIVLGFCLSLALVMVAGFIWILLNALGGALMAHFGLPLWANMTILLSVNALVLVALWNRLLSVVKQVGFTRTWHSIFGGDPTC